MDILGIIGILLGILTVILFIIKKHNIIVAAPIATIVLLLFNDVPILDSVFGSENSYMTFLLRIRCIEFRDFLIRVNFSKIHGYWRCHSIDCQ